MDHTIFMGLLLLVCVLKGLNGETKSDSPQGECQSVLDLFTKSQIGLPDDVPDTKIHDDNMEVCYKGKRDSSRVSCCTREIEHKLHSAAQKDFYETVTATSGFLKNILKADAMEYEVDFVTMVRDAQNQTDRLLGEKHSLPLKERHTPINNLFLDLQNYLKHKEVNIRESVETFFDELFPLVFRNLVNNRDSMIMTDTYRTCLTNVRQQINPRPFGDAPNAIAHQLDKTFSTSRLFLEALKVGGEVVERATSLDMGISCTRAITRLEYCSSCDGVSNVKPCLSFCKNVMRGCLVDVTQMDKQWKDYLETLEMMINNMEGYLNMEVTIAHFMKRLFEGILHSMETEHKYYQQVYKKCGRPETPEGGASSTHNSTDTHTLSPTYDGRGLNTTTMFNQMKVTVKNLMSSKLFFRGIADSICTNERFATRVEEPCWNGETVGSYTRTVPDTDVDSQILGNPEVTVTADRSPILRELLDKLIFVRKRITSRISSELMQSDGDGRYSRKHKYVGFSGDGMMDDEDYNDGFSGSGSGQGKPTRNVKNPGYNENPDDIGFSEEVYITERNNAVEAKPHNGASSSQSITIATISITTLLSIHQWLNG